RAVGHGAVVQLVELRANLHDLRVGRLVGCEEAELEREPLDVEEPLIPATVLEGVTNRTRSEVSVELERTGRIPRNGGEVHRSRIRIPGTGNRDRRRCRHST